MNTYFQVVVGFAERRRERGQVVNDEDEQQEQRYDDAGRRDVVEDPVDHGVGHGFFDRVREYVIDLAVLRERAAVPRRFDPDDRVADRQHAKEQHGEQQAQVEVVAPAGPENDVVRHVAREHRPRPDVHHDHELHHVDDGQPGREEHAHPDHALVVDQVQYVLGDFEVAVLREPFLQVPAPAPVHVPHEHGSREVTENRRHDRRHLYGISKSLPEDVRTVLEIQQAAENFPRSTILSCPYIFTIYKNEKKIKFTTIFTTFTIYTTV